MLVAAPGDAKSAKIDARPRVEQGRLKPAWQGRRLQPNACALTQCRVSNQDDWGSIDNARELIASRIEASGGPVTLPVEWRFDVKAGVEATDGWSVAIELSEDASLSLNGASIALDEREVLFDPAISSVSLPAVSAGEHLLGLTRTFAEPGDLQPPWVLGPFRVEQTDAGGRTLVVDDGSVTLGRWSEAGLPSYFGEVVYRAEVEGAPLEDGAGVMLERDWLGTVGEVRVNGKLVDAVFAAPYECDLTAQWGPGTRAVEITLTAAPDDALAGLRGLGDADVTNAGLKAPEIAIYGRGGREQ